MKILKNSVVQLNREEEQQKSNEEEDSERSKRSTNTSRTREVNLMNRF